MANTTTDRWALILGSSTGAGAAIARSLAQDPGFDVYGCHRGNHPEAATQLQRDVAAHGQRCVFDEGDAATAEAIPEAARRLAQTVPAGGIHFMVHSIANASVGRLSQMQGEALHPKQLAKTFQSMAHSFVQWTNELLGHGLLAPGARILALSNPLIQNPLLPCGAIAASKAALEVYVRYLSLELGPEGYRVNMLLFGALETPALATAMSPEGVEAIQEIHRRGAPNRRLVSEQEVGAMASFLASPGGAWFNGATIDFSGGECLGYYQQLVTDAEGKASRPTVDSGSTARLTR